MRGLLKRLTPSTVTRLVVAGVVAGFVLAISLSASAQYFSGRGVDMRALSGQATSCRAPALRLKREIIILRQDLSQILECNSQGGFYQDGDCVPYVTPGHAFSDTPTDPAELSFNNPDGTNTEWAVIGGEDGEDVTCELDCTEVTQSRDRDCPAGERGTIKEERTFQCPEQEWSKWKEKYSLCLSCDDITDPDLRESWGCDKDPEGCSAGHNDPDCCDEYPRADACDEDTCTEYTEDRPKDCPDGETGSIEESRTFECPDGEYTKWEETFNNCSEECVEDIDTDTDDCPRDQIGFIQTAREFVCPEAEWQDLPDENLCCDGQKTDPCPDGQEGTGITYTRSSCGSLWAEDSRDCSPDDDGGGGPLCPRCFCNGIRVPPGTGDDCGGGFICYECE